MNKRNIFLSVFILLIVILISSIYIINKQDKSIKLNNGCSVKYFKSIKYKKDKNRKLTYCNNAQFDKITIYSNFVPIKDKKYITFEYVGYPDYENISLYLEDNHSNKYYFKDLKNSHHTWKDAKIKIPKNLKDKVRLVAKDNSTKDCGWLGIGELHLYSSLNTLYFKQFLKTFGWIFLFSWVVSSLYGKFLNKHSSIESFILMALVLGISSYLSFYLYLYSFKIGKIFSVLFGIFILINFLMIRKDNIKPTFYLFITIFSMLALVIFLSYSNRDDIEFISHLSASKWLPMPIDNWLQKFLADSVIEHKIPWWIDGWQTSDRPPLQAGLHLIFSKVSDSNLSYLLESMGAQVLVFIFIPLMIINIIRDTKYTYILSLLLFFSGLSFINILFVWPKLFSALYQAISFYLVFLVWAGYNKSLKLYIYYGLSSSFALLTHGGGVFYLLPLSFLLLLKSLNNIKKIFLGLISAITLYLPWILYQKFIDPPGNRLLKQHLAESVGLGDNNITVIESIKIYYSNLAFNDWLDLKLTNLKKIFSGLYLYLNDILSFSIHDWQVSIFRYTDFYYLMFTTLFVILIFFIKFNSKNEKIFLKLLIYSFVLYISFWVLILTNYTVLHLGAYFGAMSGFIAITLIVYRFNRILFYILSSFNLIIFIKVYILKYFSFFNKSYIVTDIIATISLATFLLSLFSFLQLNKPKLEK